MAVSSSVLISSSISAPRSRAPTSILEADRTSTRAQASKAQTHQSRLMPGSSSSRAAATAPKKP
jgi:hypothetical protein